MKSRFKFGAIVGLAILSLIVGCEGSVPINPEPLVDGGTSSTTASESSATSTGSGGMGGAGGSSQGAGGCSECSNGSGSRLKAILNTGSDGAVHKSDGVYFDSSIGLQCAVAAAPDGAQRCLPFVGAAPTVGFFVDSNCTTPIGAVVKQAGCANPKPPTHAFQTVVSGCSTVWRVYPVTGVHGGSVYSNSGGSCTSVNPATLANFTLYSVGPEINYASFVAFTESHE